MSKVLRVCTGQRYTSTDLPLCLGSIYMPNPRLFIWLVGCGQPCVIKSQHLIDIWNVGLSGLSQRQHSVVRGSIVFPKLITGLSSRVRWELSSMDHPGDPAALGAPGQCGWETKGGGYGEKC